jgi:hypothetical protein
MAASPIAAFPVIKALFTVDLYRYFRANRSAGSAAVAFTGFFHKTGRQISGCIQFIRMCDLLLGTECDAELTSLAKYLVNDDSSLHKCFVLIGLITSSHQEFHFNETGTHRSGRERVRSPVSLQSIQLLYLDQDCFRSEAPQASAQAAPKAGKHYRPFPMLVASVLSC